MININRIKEKKIDINKMLDIMLDENNTYHIGSYGNTIAFYIFNNNEENMIYNIDVNIRKYKYADELLKYVKYIKENKTNFNTLRYIQFKYKFINKIAFINIIDIQEDIKDYI